MLDWTAKLIFMSWPIQVRYPSWHLWNRFIKHIVWKPVFYLHVFNDCISCHSLPLKLASCCIWSQGLKSFHLLSLLRKAFDSLICLKTCILKHNFNYNSRKKTRLLAPASCDLIITGEENEWLDVLTVESTAGLPVSQVLFQDRGSLVFPWTRDKHSPRGYQKFIGRGSPDLNVCRCVKMDEWLHSFADVSCIALRCLFSPLWLSGVIYTHFLFCFYSSGHWGQVEQRLKLKFKSSFESATAHNFILPIDQIMIYVMSCVTRKVND